MCGRCGRIYFKKHIKKHLKVHKTDNLIRRQKGNVKVYQPFWAEQVDIERGIGDDWEGAPPKLLDPVPMYEECLQLLAQGIRIPTPFAHFASIPIWKIWLDCG